ncbi:hypothetical protein AGDE_15615 [Angomonas deanei]|uniref:Uncharacterized protein n=1 Tax=Angomonas deanei TaxID=59799 RepID=A0A7G2CNT7_9TRYP|nr:hypothetical protein AGDE_15615 [Angomonas deanei]CAD2220767.1 hypothetical protein, conserved [Angomonas deanei]|eukprot:EPY18763.1 hypothetical protein AGDE_15615 [Angomonas deanei]
MSLQSGKEIVDEDFLQNHSFKGFHAQSFSLSDSISRRSRRAAVAILTESAISGANFFPIHFAEVLCTSTEGCEDMKQRDLWKRSVALLQQQPLPPDIVVDDVVDDSSDMSQQEESDNEDLNKHSRQDFHHRKKANHNSNNGMSSVVVMNGNTMNTVTTDNYNNNSVGMGISSSMVPKNVVRGAENTYTTHDTARREDNTNTTAQTKGGEEIAVVEQEVNSHELQRLKKGQLTQTSIISAARGYNRSAAAAYTLDCAGDPLKLMEAIIVVGMALSTEPGFTQLAVTEEGHLVEILFAIARFASHLTLRTCTQIALCLIARNRAGRKYMRSRDCCTVKNPDAYVSAEGIPYAVSFSHMRFDRTITLSRRKAKKNTAPGNAYAGYGGVDLQGIPKSIVDHVCSLANPVSRENAKKALYKALKKNPTQFLEPNVMRLCLEVSNVYRLDRAERKFITELIQRAQARPQKVPAVTSDGAK